MLFGVPGAFTPTCSDHHLPGFVIRAEDLRAKGVDRIACVSVNDAFVMRAWGEAQGVGDSVTLIADGSAAVHQGYGLEVDLTGGGLGVRSKRYAAVIRDGVVAHLAVEDTLGARCQLRGRRPSRALTSRPAGTGVRARRLAAHSGVSR